MNLEKIPSCQKRQFLDNDANLKCPGEVSRYYQKLIDEEIGTLDEFEQWILEYSELESAISQQGAILYIKMTCQTDDCLCAKQYKDFIESVIPVVKPLEDVLNKKILKVSGKFKLDEKRYNVYLRNVKTDQEIFVKENVDLETRLELLSQRYQTLSGAMTVKFQGKEQTMPQMGKYLRDPDRVLRESAWRAMTQRRLKDRDTLDEIFDEMRELRCKVASNAGFDGYCKYRFKELHRFDYTPDDCKKYHNAVEKLVVPVVSEILENRKNKMGLNCLRPWDTSVDPQGLPPLKPFERIEDLIGGCKDVFDSLDSELGKKFGNMQARGLLDLENRKGKAPGGYQSTLDEARKPFIFMNAVGVDRDVRTLLHEGGHAFHSLATANEPLLGYRHAPMEFCEVASMSMELLGSKYLGRFYNDEDLIRSNKEHLEDVIQTLVWVAIIDAFQHWIYENPKHTIVQRKFAWLDIRKRFGTGLIDWEGLEEEHQYLWHPQLHIFEVPFYYIEYGIAQLGALQIWKRFNDDPAAAMNGYKKALAFGGARPLPELFTAAGIKFDFSENTIAPLIEFVKKEIKNLFF